MLFPLWLLGKGDTGSVPPPTDSFLLQEDLFLILQEDSFRIIIESGIVSNDYLLQEDGFLLLQEDSSRLIIT